MTMNEFEYQATQELAALEQRISDIYAGASGEGLEDCGLTFKELCAVRRCIRAIFDSQTGSEDARYEVWNYWTLPHWETPKKLAQYMYNCGIRAQGSQETEQ